MQHSQSALGACLDNPIKCCCLHVGAYDPKLVQGWKADPKSAFAGDERFKASQEVSEGEQQQAATATAMMRTGCE